MKIFNTLSGKKEIFKPIEKGKLSMYVCGMTVYDDTHIGHARTFLSFDLIVRYLRSIDFEVTYIRNITDVDDKIISRAKELNLTPKELTTKYIASMDEDFLSLGMQKPDAEPRATENIDSIISLIEILIDKGHAYVGDADVYFSTESHNSYGKLSRRNLEDMLVGARIDVDLDKKNPTDFVLWKKDTEGLKWDSPWGEGRPGWHIECSAMSMDALGETFDIHGGGSDLKFPHHENEIAQSCVSNGTDKFANYWVHNGFVTMNKEKMSKSLGNITTIEDATKKYSGQVVRLSLLSAQYKQPLDWNNDLLMEQSKTLDKWYSMYSSEVSEKTPECFNDLLDDMNTPLYISKLHELFQQSQNGDNDKKKEFNKACRLIGLFNETTEKRAEYKKSKVK